MRTAFQAIVLAVTVSLTLASAPMASATVEISDIHLLLLAETFKLKDLASVQVATDEVIADDDDFILRKVSLKHAQLGEINMKIRQPKQDGRYSLLFMSTGLHAGMDAIDLVKTPVPMVTAAFDYPVPKKAIGPQLAAEVFSSILRIQGQFVVALAWLQNQPMVRAERINLLNVSFGSFATPMAQRLAQLLGINTYSTVYAFGGADPAQLIVPELTKLSLQAGVSQADVKSMVAIVNQLSALVDARPHLQKLNGRFLVIQGAQDTLVTAASTEALYTALPQPKSLTVLDFPHIDTSRPDIIEATGQAIFQWFASQDAL